MAGVIISLREILGGGSSNVIVNAPSVSSIVDLHYFMNLDEMNAAATNDGDHAILEVAGAAVLYEFKDNAWQQVTDDRVLSHLQVNDINARDALIVIGDNIANHALVRVKDASADDTVADGHASYFFSKDGGSFSGFIKESEQESIEAKELINFVNLNLGNEIGKLDQRMNDLNQEVADSQSLLLPASANNFETLQYINHQWQGARNLAVNGLFGIQYNQENGELKLITLNNGEFSVVINNVDSASGGTDDNGDASTIPIMFANPLDYLITTEPLNATLAYSIEVETL